MYSNKRGFGGGGKSAYDLAVEEGFEGSLEEWLESLKGADGKNGTDGINGEDGTDGTNGKDGKDGTNGSDGKDGFGTEEQYNAIIDRLDALEAIE